MRYRGGVLAAVCFSSQHSLTIFVRKGIEVILEDEIGYNDDIKAFIKSRLRLGTPKRTELLRSQILERSAGRPTVKHS